jgi:hypothetical protein
MKPPADTWFKTRILGARQYNNNNNNNNNNNKIKHAIVNFSEDIQSCFIHQIIKKKQIVFNKRYLRCVE